MKEDMDLSSNLRRLALEQPREASQSVEHRLMAAFRTRQPRRVPSWLYIAAAACVVIVLGLSFFQKRQPPAVYSYEAPGFVALPYAQSGVPLESVVVIRVQMRPSELSSMGVAVPAAASSAQITADLMVGQDGVARAVRFVE